MTLARGPRVPAGKGTAPLGELQTQMDPLPCPQEKEGYGGEWVEDKPWGTEEQRQGLKLV